MLEFDIKLAVKRSGGNSDQIDFLIGDTPLLGWSRPTVADLTLIPIDPIVAGHRSGSRNYGTVIALTGDRLRNAAMKHLGDAVKGGVICGPSFMGAECAGLVPIPK